MTSSGCWLARRPGETRAATYRGSARPALPAARRVERVGELRRAAGPDSWSGRDTSRVYIIRHSQEAVTEDLGTWPLLRMSIMYPSYGLEPGGLVSRYNARRCHLGWLTVARPR